jgi:photosystem II stability/assembly factor-like uncharacterized protein
MKKTINYLLRLLIICFTSVSNSLAQSPTLINPLVKEWKATELAPGGRIDAIADLGDGILIAGSRGNSYGRIFRSEDYGLTWTLAQNIAEPARKGSVTCVAKGSGTDAYLLTEQGDFWRSKDRGKSWTFLAHLTENKNREGFAASYGIMVTKLGTILVTNTDSAGGHIFRSTDRGGQWQDLGLISTRGLYRFTDVGKGILVNGWEGSVYKSEDDGLTWRIRTVLENGKPLYATEYLGSAMAIQASEAGNIYKGSVFGGDWRKVATLTGAADDFAYLGYGIIIYSTYTENRDIYLSLDAGETWQNIGGTGTGVEGDWLDHFIVVPTEDKVICIGGSSKGYILRLQFEKDQLYQKTLPKTGQKVQNESSSSLQFASAKSAVLWSENELNEPEDVLIDGNNAYVPNRDGNNLTVIDIANPKKPRIVSSFRDPELLDAMGVDKHGDILYVTSLTNHKLLILDAHHPKNMRKLSSLTIGGEGRSTDRLRKVVYADGYVYLTHSSEGKLYIVDVRNPQSPVIVGSTATGDGAFAAVIHGNYAYVGGCFPGASLKVIDIADKTAPKVINTLYDAEKYGCICSFQINGKYLYTVAYSSNAFITFDISDPSRPVEAGYLRSNLLDGPGRLVLDGSAAYVINSINDSFATIDISDPKSPRLVHILNDRQLEKAYGLAYSKGHSYIAGRDSRSLVVLEMAKLKPAELDLVGFLKDSKAINAPEDIMIRNNIAYIPCRDGGSLTLVDVADPANPSIRRVFKDKEITDAMGIDINENYLYLTSMTNRMVLILDIGDPDRIKKIASIQLGVDGPNSDRLRKVVYRDNHLFVTHGNSGTLFILNIDDQANPKLISQVETGDGAFNVFLKGNYAYIGGCGGTSLNVIDISDLYHPKLVNTLANDKNYRCLCSFSSAGNYLFAIGFFSSTFVVFDISNPVNIKEVALIKDARLNGANRLYQNEDQIYIATALTDGMVQIDVSNPINPKITHMISSQLLDKAYGITYYKDKVYVVGRDANSMVIFSAGK